MFSNDRRELAMTHFASGVGYSRPAHVLETAKRVRRWAGERETCKSCSDLPAVCVRGGLALCGRCRENRRGTAAWGEAFLPSRVERADDDDGTEGVALRGLAIVTNQMSLDLGGFREVVKPSALDRFEAERPDLVYLWSHNSDDPIARMSAGNMRAKRTSKGLLVEVDPQRGSANRVDLVAKRVVRQQSFGFIVEPDDGDEWYVLDGEIFRDVLDMRVIEASAVVWPAYPQTTLEVIRSDQRREWYREQETAERLRMVR